jgi:deazaflavin-dependent oxidoreductase (nitroreductase family)
VDITSDRPTEKELPMLYGKQHVERYLATDGDEGFVWRNGTNILILTTTGRRSGEPRSTPLIFREHGDDYLVVASNGGSDEPPDWYRNLEAAPTVRVQVMGDRFTARARAATPDERPDMWRRMNEVWPDYDRYQGRTEREIPVVVLQRL